MSKRSTIRDLAREAGVSVATVDRVLNARLPVREDTARRVYEVAVALDYHAVSILQEPLKTPYLSQFPHIDFRSP